MQSAKSRRCLVGNGSNSGRNFQLQLHKLRLLAELLDFIRNLPCRLLVRSVGQHDIGAGLRQRFADFAADAAATSGY